MQNSIVRINLIKPMETIKYITKAKGFTKTKLTM
jgi:hypothetical protein